MGFRISPSAKRTRVQGVYGDRLKVQVASPPEDDRANTELVTALASWLRLPRDYVSVQVGHKARDKVLLFRGLEEADLRRRLAGLTTPAGAGRLPSDAPPPERGERCA